MRLLSLFAVGVPLVQASYFSEGWTPGQPVPTLAATPTLGASKPTVTPAPVPTPGAKWNWAEFSSKHLDLAKFMTEGPIASALPGVYSLHTLGEVQVLNNSDVGKVLASMLLNTLNRLGCALPREGGMTECLCSQTIITSCS